MTNQESSKSSKNHQEIDLDSIINELGTFGKFQLINFTLICIPIIFNAVFTLGYIFTAGAPDYRCKIPECEYGNVSENIWTEFAIPDKYDGTPQECARYAPAYNQTLVKNASCSAVNFNQSNVISCNDFVYETKEVTIMNEWNLTCPENQWKLTLVGTINNIGQFFCLPLTGFVSDNYGRRMALVIGLTMGGIFGIIRSFSVNYVMFLVFEFLDPLFSAGCYTVAFVLGMEFLGPQQRVLGGVIISCFYAVGGIFIGLVSYAFQNWRHFLLTFYIPPIFAFTYIWIVPESLRWLLNQSRIVEIKEIVEKAAKMNKITLSDKTKERLDQSSSQSILDLSKNVNEKTNEYPLLAALKNVKLMIRLAICSFCWLTNTFVYYGLNLNAVTLAGNKYFNFILSNVIEIPAHLLSLVLVNRLGRRWSMCGSLILAGLSCIATEFIPIHEDNIRLCLYLIGKFSISISFTIVYVYTTELFPTVLRNSLLGVCSMFGRFGSISAPQTPLLASISPSLPLYLFGGTSILAGIFSLSFPETLNTRLPDTIEEAMNIGSNQNLHHKEEAM